MKPLLRVGGLSCLLLAASPARGAELWGALWAHCVDKKPRIDGVLRDWRAEFVSLSHTLKGSTDGGEPQARGGVAYDDQHLYVAMEVTDNKLVRTGAAGANEDHAALLIAFVGRGGSYRTRTLSLYPGDPGKRAGVVKLDGHTVKGAKIVEAPTDKGFTLEASVPWSAIAESRRVRVGMRGALRYVDADRRGRVKATIASSTANGGKALPPLLTLPEQGLYSALIEPKHLPNRPVLEQYGAVTGGSFVERVAVFGTYLTIAGPGYRDGKEFYYSDLGTREPEDVKKLELRDFDGDGTQEIVLVKRVGVGSEYQDILQVLHVGPEGEPAEVFRHEIGFGTSAGSVSNTLKIRKKGRGFALEIAQGESEGFEKEGAPETTGLPGALRPWEPVGSRTFAWRDGKIQQTGEKRAKPKRPPPEGAGVAVTSTDGSEPNAWPDIPPPPRPPNPDELLEQVYAAYRKSRGSKRDEPRFDFVTDVAGDKSPERIVVHDKDVVVFGKNYRGGTSFAYIDVGVASPKDVLRVTARDLTGDGKAEIIVYGKLKGESSEELDGEPVDRHALLVYRVTEQSIARIFAAETGRSMDGKHVLGAVAFVPSEGPALSIELRPGQAAGWTRKTYPFSQDTAPVGGLEPLVLPWSKRRIRFAFDGGAFRAE